MAFFDKILPTAVGNGLGTAQIKAEEGINKIATTFGLQAPFRKNVATDKRPAAAPATTEAAVSAQTTKQLQSAQEQPADDHQVRLVEIGTNESVVFKVMPDVAESRTVEYEAVAPPQSPGAFQKYKGTASVQWTINATLISRTTAEATENLQIIARLRGWTKPFFGEQTNIDYPGKLGAPPPVLWFSGWRKNMVGKVPTVITSLNWSFPQDVDYIPAYELFQQSGSSLLGYKTDGKLIPFPTVMKVTITLLESFSTDEFNGFSLRHFRSGDYEKAWQSRPTISEVRRAANGPIAAVGPASAAGAPRGTGS